MRWLTSVCASCDVVLERQPLLCVLHVNLLRISYDPGGGMSFRCTIAVGNDKEAALQALMAGN